MSSVGENELQKFLLAQIEEINKYKWIESEKRCHDIGFQQAAMEWINRYSACFKKGWGGGEEEEGENGRRGGRGGRGGRGAGGF